jgi:hypothetical protein
MSLLTMTDCTEEANRVQALHELERAEVIGSVENDGMAVRLAAWALKWGRPLIEAARGAITPDDHAYALTAIEAEVTSAEADRDDYKAAIDKAINALDEIESDDETRRAIDAAVAILENA